MNGYATIIPFGAHKGATVRDFQRNMTMPSVLLKSGVRISDVASRMSLYGELSTQQAADPTATFQVISLIEWVETTSEL